MEAVLALATEHTTFWWITLGLGAVVIVAVIVLLSLLHAFVTDIDNNVKETWETATTFARNTQTTWMLNQTAMLTGELANEVRTHAQMLGAMGGARR